MNMNKLIFAIALISPLQKAYSMDDYRERLVNSTETVVLTPLIVKRISDLKLRSCHRPTPDSDAEYSGIFIDDQSQIIVRYKPEIEIHSGNFRHILWKHAVNPYSATFHSQDFFLDLNPETAKILGKSFEEITDYYKKTADLLHLFFVLRQDNESNYLLLLPNELGVEVVKFVASE